MADGKAFSGVFRLIAVIVVVVVAVGLLGYSVLIGLSHSVADQATLDWETQLGTLDDVLERYPSRDCNDAAIGLEPLVAALGFSITPRETRDVPVADAADEAWSEVAGRMGKYIERELERTDGPLQPPKKNVAAWLEANRESLDAVSRYLQNEPTPRWLLRLEGMFSAPVPNLLGHMHLQRALGADAIYRAQLGDTATALDRLEASWRLNLSLRDDPVLITQLISLFGARLHVGTLRHLGPVPAIWHRRIEAIRPRDSLIRAIELEAWTWKHLEEPVNAMPVNDMQRMGLRMVAPYIRLCAADASQRMRRAVERLKTVGYLCDRDLAPLGADLDLELPAWNHPGRLMVPRLGGAVRRVARLELDIELTVRVLELHDRIARGDALPATSGFSQPSTACADDRWIYRFDDGATIELSRTIEWPDAIGVVLPTRYATGF